MTRLRAARPKNCGGIIGKGKRFSRHSIQPEFEAQPPSYTMITGVSFTGGTVTEVFN
jgi:hypothetical protein